MVGKLCRAARITESPLLNPSVLTRENPSRMPAAAERTIAVNSNGPCGPASTLTGTSTLSLNGIFLAANDRCTFSVPLIVPAGAADGTYNNAASGGAILVGASTVSFTTANDALVVLSETLTWDKEFIDGPVAPGGTATLRFSIESGDIVYRLVLLRYFRRRILVDNIRHAGFAA